MRLSLVFSALTLGSLFVYPQASVGQQTAKFNAADKAAIEQLFDQYIHAYSTKDYAKLRASLQAPFVRFPATWEVYTTLDDVMKYYRNQRDPLDKDSYDHTTFGRSRMTVLSADRALVDKTYKRYRKDGTLLLETSTVYVVSKSSGMWKICGTFAHDLKDFGKTY
jgi:hypothetical protein